jgi:hypothetical protein
MTRKRLLLPIVLIAFLFVSFHTVKAGWVRGYFRSDGTWVNGYYRTEPNYYKWDNLSWDGNWFDAINDKSWYRDFGYDPEPWDNEIPNYSYWGYPRFNYINNYDLFDNGLNWRYDWDYDWSNWDWTDFSNLY